MLAFTRRHLPAVLLVVFVLTWTAMRGSVAAEEPAVAPEAKKVLDAFGKYYQGLQRFSYTVDIDLTVEQQGQKQSQQFVQKFSAERPNKLAFHFDSPQGGAQVISDGKQLAVYLKGFNKYATQEAPATWAAMFEDPILLGTMSFGNAAVVSMALLSEDPAKKLIERSEKVEYGGQVDLDGVKCHLIKSSGGEVDWQLWIDASDKPLARQFVPDLSKAFERLAKNSKAKSQLADLKVTNIVTFKDWQTDPKFDAATFAFKAPEAATKVDSLMEILGGGRRAEPQPHALLGEAAPPINIEVLDGGKLDLASLKNKVVILDFWATWCGPCVQAMPVIHKVAEKFKDKGVVLYAVNLMEEKEDIQKFLEDSGLKLTVALDKDGEVGKAYLAEAIPQTVIIGKDGSVQVVHVGLSPNLAAELQKEIESLLAGKDLASETLAAFKAKAEEKAKAKQKADEAEKNKAADE